MKTQSKGKRRSSSSSQSNQTNFNLQRPKRKAPDLEEQTNKDESGNGITPNSPRNASESPSRQDALGSPSRENDLESRIDSRSSQRKKIHLEDDIYSIPRVIIDDADPADLTPTTADFDKRILNKILEIEQKNSFILRELARNQLKFEHETEVKLNDISDSVASLKEQKSVLNDVKQETKNSAFYKETIRQLSHKLFHDHEMASDEKMKEMLKKMLEDDETCAEKLEELKRKGVSFEKLWNDSLYSGLLGRNRVKKGYYIRRVKEALWATFGIHRIEPFDENFTREQMKNWKMSSKTRKAYDELYNPINPDNEASETYLESIIKKVFVSDKEQTKKNSIWCQAILEIIFDEKYLTSKIETDTIDQWYTKLLKDSNNRSEEGSSDIDN